MSVQERQQAARLEELESRLMGKVDSAIAVIKQNAGRTNPDDILLKTVMQVAEGSATKVRERFVLRSQGWPT